MQTVPSESSAPTRLPVVLTAAVLFLGAGVAYVGIQYQPLTAPAPAPSTAIDPVVRIDLPHEDFPVPAGPHRERFQVNCTVCHSPRLVFTQPRLPEKTWQAVVHKMVAVYGAPMSPEEEKLTVDYLFAVNGQGP